RKTAKRIQAISAETAATPETPRKPAIRAMIKKRMAKRNISFSFPFCSMELIQPNNIKGANFVPPFTGRCSSKISQIVLVPFKMARFRTWKMRKSERKHEHGNAHGLRLSRIATALQPSGGPLGSSAHLPLSRFIWRYQRRLLRSYRLGLPPAV